MTLTWMKRFSIAFFILNLILVPTLFYALIVVAEFLGINFTNFLLITAVTLLLDYSRALGKAIILPIAVLIRKAPILKRRYKVSVVIPAYNEEENIGRCIESVLENDYENKQVIVVDDGSTDNTYAVASRYRDKVLVLRRPRSGLKAYALNYGLKFADGDIIVTLDADTVIARDALERIVAYFQDGKIVAACGNLRVLNSGDNILTKLQSYEYIVGFEIGRRLQALFRTLLILPGAMSIIRKRVVESVGGYDPMLGEDFDLTLKLHKIRGRLEFLHDVYSWTYAPNSWKAWLRQRLRWHRSQMRVLIRHRNIFLGRIFGPPGLLGAPDMVLMDFIALVLRPIWILYFMFAYKWIFVAMILALLYFITELHTLLAALSLIEYPRDLKYFYAFVLNLIFYRPIYGLVRLYSYFVEAFNPSYRW